MNIFSNKAVIFLIEIMNEKREAFIVCHPLFYYY